MVVGSYRSCSAFKPICAHDAHHVHTRLTVHAITPARVHAHPHTMAAPRGTPISHRTRVKGPARHEGPLTYVLGTPTPPDARYGHARGL